MAKSLDLGDITVTHGSVTPLDRNDVDFNDSGFDDNDDSGGGNDDFWDRW